MDDSTTGFRNEPVELAALPDFSRVELEPVTPGYTAYSVVVNSAVGLGLAVGVGVALGSFIGVRMGLTPGGLAALVLAGGFAAYGLLDARCFGWAVRDHDVITQGGVLWRKSVVLPLVRIQHVEMASGPVERAFGTRRLQAFSAGSGSADLVIYGLTPERAERVRAYLLERISQEPGGDALA